VIRRFIVWFFAAIGILVVLAVVGGLVAWRVYAPKSPQIAESTVLELDLTQNVAEASPRDAVSRIVFEDKPDLRDLLDALQRAGNDARVKGVFARLGNDGLGTAMVQELRQAIDAFRAKGKFAIAFADTFGEFSAGNRSYYLATAFDDLWLQPLGQVGLVGIRAEAPHLRGLLDKLAVVPRLDHRSEYKSAMNMLTDGEMAAPEREELQAIVDGIGGQLVRDVAKSRRLRESEVRKIVDGGPYMADAAEKLRLVDHLGYRDEAVAAARTRAGGIAALLGPVTYLARAGRPNREGPVIALIHADGLIGRGESESSPLGGGVLGAESVAKAFRAALADPKVRAIVLRIDSPGGSAVASETIWRETVRARAAHIPVIASMGDVAGSGGYYIAAAADKIVAQPATLTGSIGVVAGKLLTGGLWDKLGVRWGAVQQGENAAMFSTLEDFSPDGEAHFQGFLDTVYAGFKERVAAGRKLDAAIVEKLAKGRVWTGEDAKAKGLVDELGGYETALRLARVAANLDPAAPITLRTYPPQREARAVLLDWLTGREGDEDARVGTALLGETLRLGRIVAPLAREIEAVTSSAGVTQMPLLRTR
jgi:protease-4